LETRVEETTKTVIPSAIWGAICDMPIQRKVLGIAASDQTIKAGFAGYTGRSDPGVGSQKSKYQVNLQSLLVAK